MTTEDDEAWVAALRGNRTKDTGEAVWLEGNELRRFVLDAHAARSAEDDANPHELQRLLFRLHGEQLLDPPAPTAQASAINSTSRRLLTRVGVAVAAVLILSVTIFTFWDGFRDPIEQRVTDNRPDTRPSTDHLKSGQRPAADAGILNTSAGPPGEQPSTTITKPAGMPIAKPATPTTPAVVISALGLLTQIQNVDGTARPPPTIIAFNVNSASLTVESREVLDVASRAFNESALANNRFLLEGRADLRGSERSLGLARRRAEAVRDYLVSRGVNAQRLVINVVDDPDPVWADNSGNRSVVKKPPEVSVQTRTAPAP